MGDRIAADYDRYHGPDAHPDEEAPKLKPAQLAVMKKAKATELIPITEAPELRALAGLVKQGLLEVHVTLTAAGVAVAADLLADEPGDLLSDEEYRQLLDQEMKDATEDLARAERNSDDADARCMHTPLGESNLGKLRDASSRGMDRVENAKERLAKAKRELAMHISGGLTEELSS